MHLLINKLSASYVRLPNTLPAVNAVMSAYCSCLHKPQEFCGELRRWILTILILPHHLERRIFDFSSLRFDWIVFMYVCYQVLSIANRTARFALLTRDASTRWVTKHHTRNYRILNDKILLNLADAKNFEQESGSSASKVSIERIPMIWKMKEQILEIQYLGIYIFGGVRDIAQSASGTACYHSLEYRVCTKHTKCWKWRQDGDDKNAKGVILITDIEMWVHL